MPCLSFCLFVSLPGGRGWGLSLELSAPTACQILCDTSSSWKPQGNDHRCPALPLGTQASGMPPEWSDIFAAKPP